MSEQKTRPTDDDLEALLAAIPDPQRQGDCRALDRLLREATGCDPEIWSGGMVGYGRYRYRYESGREGEWFLTGFASRASALTLYVVAGYPGEDDLLARLGRIRSGKSCLYLKRLSDVDTEVLREMVVRSVASLRETWPVQPGAVG